MKGESRITARTTSVTERKSLQVFAAIGSLTMKQQGRVTVRKQWRIAWKNDGMNSASSEWCFSKLLKLVVSKLHQHWSIIVLFLLGSIYHKDLQCNISREIYRYEKWKIDEVTATATRNDNDKSLKWHSERTYCDKYLDKQDINHKVFNDNITRETMVQRSQNRKYNIKDKSRREELGGQPRFAFREGFGSFLFFNTGIAKTASAIQIIKNNRAFI